MASFGEGLAKAFSDTFGAVTRGRYMSVLADKMQRDIAEDEGYKKAVSEGAEQFGIRMPGGSPAAAAAPTPMQAPASVAAEGGGDSPPASPRPAGPPQGTGQFAQTPADVPAQRFQPRASAVQAPVSVPSQPSPLTTPPDVQGTPASAVSQALSPTPAAQRAPAPAPAPAQAPQETPRGSAVASALQPEEQPPASGVSMPADNVEPQLRAQVMRAVEESKDPATVMLGAGLLSTGGVIKREELPVLRQQVPGLVQAVQESRGADKRGPFTKEDWNGFLQHMSLSAMKHLSPDKQMQAFAVIDKVRATGLMQGVSVAMAAAQAGDMEGAANALNSANSFLPDGYKNTFRAVQGGVQITREREDGQGEKVVQVIPAAQIESYGMMLLDPKAAVKHMLDVRQFEETKRSNLAREGLTAEGLKVQREGHVLQAERLRLDARLRQDALDLRRDEAERAHAGSQRDAAGVTAWQTWRDTAVALTEAEESGASPGRLKDLREAEARARAGWFSALPGMTGAGAQKVSALEQTASAADQRSANARARNESQTAARAGRSPLTESQIKLIAEQGDTFLSSSENLSQNKTIMPAAIWAASQAGPFLAANNQSQPRDIMGVLKRWKDANPGVDIASVATITDATSGLTLRVPYYTSPRDARRGGAGDESGVPDPRTLPRAPEQRTGALQSMVGAAGAPSGPPPGGYGANMPEGSAARAIGQSRIALPRSEPQRPRVIPPSEDVIARAVTEIRGMTGRAMVSPSDLYAVATKYGIDPRILQSRLR